MPARRFALLYTACAILYLLSASGRLVMVDCLTYFSVAKSIALEGTLAVGDCRPDPQDNHCVPGVGGLGYSGLGLAPSFLAAPVIKVISLFARDSAWFDRICETAVSLLNCFVSPFVVCILAWAANQFGYSWRTACLLGLLGGFGTPLWQFTTKGYWSEPLFALGLTLSILVLVAKAPRASILSGFAFGLAVLARPAGIVLAPLLISFTLLQAPKAQRWRSAVSFLLPLGLFVGIILTANAVRFGNPLLSGYHTKFPTLGRLFNVSFIHGLSGLFVDTDCGLLYFAPWLLLLPWVGREFWRQRPRESLLFLSIFVGTVLFFSRYSDWQGGSFSSGPRMLVAVTIPMTFFALPAIRAPFKRRSHLVCLVLLVWGFAAQFITIINPASRFQNRLAYQSRIGEPLESWQRQRLLMSWLDLGELRWLPSSSRDVVSASKDDAAIAYQSYLRLMSRLTKETSFPEFLEQVPSSINQTTPDLLTAKLVFYSRRATPIYFVSILGIGLSLAMLWAVLQKRSAGSEYGVTTESVKELFRIRKVG